MTTGFNKVKVTGDLEMSNFREVARVKSLTVIGFERKC